MSLLARVVLAVFLATSFASQTLALDKASPNVVQGLVAFGSDEGVARLTRSEAKVDFPALANQFEAQSNAAFCGPTTVAIILNTVWMPTATLIKGMRTFDTLENRGYILVQAR